MSARVAPCGTLSSSTMIVMMMAITPSLNASSRVVFMKASAVPSDLEDPPRVAPADGVAQRRLEPVDALERRAHVGVGVREVGAVHDVVAAEGLDRVAQGLARIEGGIGVDALQILARRLRDVGAARRDHLPAAVEAGGQERQRAAAVGDDELQVRVA